MNQTLVHAGLGLRSQATLDLHLQGHAWSFAHDPPGCAALIARVQSLGVPVQVICEATGGWERPIVAALHAAGQPVSVVNPRQVRDFARGRGQRAKTDRIDAEMLAEFGAANAPAPTLAPSAAQAELSAWVTRREQLAAMLRAERARQIPGLPKPVAKDLASLAPFNDDSGPRKGQRHIAAGRTSVRCGSPTHQPPYSLPPPRPSPWLPSTPSVTTPSSNPSTNVCALPANPSKSPSSPPPENSSPPSIPFFKNLILSLVLEHRC